MDFLVVEFTQTEEVAVIPKSWSKGKDLAFWPPYKDTTKITRAVQKQESVNPQRWLLFPIRIFKEYATYMEARQNLKRSVVDSSLESDSGNAKSSRTRGSRAGRKSEKGGEHEVESDVSSDGNEEIRSIPKPTKTIPPPPAFPSSSLSRAEGQQTNNVMKSMLNPTRSVVPQTDYQSSYFCLTEGSGIQSQSDQRDFALTSETRSGSSLDSLSPVTNDPVEPDVGNNHNIDDGDTARKMYLLRNDRIEVPEVDEELPFEIYVVKSLERLHQKLDLQGQVLVNALRGLSTTRCNDSELRESFKFPLTTVEDVDSLESKIKNLESRMKLVDYLSFIGGSDYKDNLARILHHMLDDKLASEYAWEGIRKVNPKRPFKSLQIVGVIFDAVRRNPLCKTVTDAELRKKGSTWIAHASDRIKSFTARAQAITPDVTSLNSVT